MIRLKYILKDSLHSKIVKRLRANKIKLDKIYFNVEETRKIAGDEYIFVWKNFDEELGKVLFNHFLPNETDDPRDYYYSLEVNNDKFVHGLLDSYLTLKE